MHTAINLRWWRISTIPARKTWDLLAYMFCAKDQWTWQLLLDGHSSHLLIISLDTPWPSQLVIMNPTAFTIQEVVLFGLQGFLGVWGLSFLPIPNFKEWFYSQKSSVSYYCLHTIFTPSTSQVFCGIQDLKHPFARLTSPILPDECPLYQSHSTSTALLWNFLSLQY